MDCSAKDTECLGLFLFIMLKNRKQCQSKTVKFGYLMLSQHKRHKVHNTRIYSHQEKTSQSQSQARDFEYRL